MKILLGGVAAQPHTQTDGQTDGHSGRPHSVSLIAAATAGRLTLSSPRWYLLATALFVSISVCRCVLLLTDASVVFPAEKNQRSCVPDPAARRTHASTVKGCRLKLRLVVGCSKPPALVGTDK